MSSLQFSPTETTVMMVVQAPGYLLYDTIPLEVWHELQTGRLPWPSTLGRTELTRQGEQLAISWEHPDGSHPVATISIHNYTEALLAYYRETGDMLVVCGGEEGQELVLSGVAGEHRVRVSSADLAYLAATSSRGSTLLSVLEDLTGWVWNRQDDRYQVTVGDEDYHLTGLNLHQVMAAY